MDRSRNDHTLRLAWLALLLAPFAHAGDPVRPLLEVEGGDFPVLMRPVGRAPQVDEEGTATGCESVRARRVDEVGLPWRKAVDRVALDCQPLDEESAGVEMVALSGVAYLKRGAVTMAGHPVVEVRLMDSAIWGDHQYLLDADYAQAAKDLRRLVETRCLQRRLREETGPALACTMTDTASGLYLMVDEISGIWIHADPDDARRTVYAEAWAD